MKCIFKILLKLLSQPKDQRPTFDDVRWDTLDGAEFSVVYQRQTTATTLEA